MPQVVSGGVCEKKAAVLLVHAALILMLFISIVTPATSARALRNTARATASALRLKDFIAYVSACRLIAECWSFFLYIYRWPLLLKQFAPPSFPAPSHRLSAGVSA